eukprot:CAMPEP_0119573020 /NCGR_PEP_ID=MMETSP1352-20130426/44915_1 /TAXON_ID=265584 /ORGANISM="Stauroneis constricta, Strain CCMP1120" /LENGTH=517 /DNA_ID=CAMNT_0007622707 /DNA_START=1297 /DNA_END=2847 /DNA_ORIENTATION=-
MKVAISPTSRMHPIAVMLLSAALVGNDMLQPASAAAAHATADDADVSDKKNEVKTINYALLRRRAAPDGDDLDHDEDLTLDGGLQAFATHGGQGAAGAASSSSPEEMAVFRKAKKDGNGANIPNPTKTTKAAKGGTETSTAQPTMMPSTPPSLEPTLTPSVSLQPSAQPSFMPTFTPCASEEERTAFIDARIDGCGNSDPSNISDANCNALTVALRAKPTLVDYFLCASKDSILNFNNIKNDPGMLKQLQHAASVTSNIEYFTGTAAPGMLKQLQHAASVTSNIEYFTGTAAQVKSLCDAARAGGNAAVVCCDSDSTCANWHDDSIMTIASDSCQGGNSCNSMGGEALILSGSCKGGGSTCRSLSNTSRNGPNNALKSDGIVLIGPDACKGETDVCAFFAGYVTGFKTVGKGSCVGGNSACFSLGVHERRDAINNNDFEIRVGENSCTAPRACVNVNSNSQSDTVIGDASCTAGFSCDRVGRESKFPVEIDDAICTTVEECQECGYYNFSMCSSSET